ncbi:hypothetical protein Tco_0264526 [Tanacetum coccineum]
MNKVKNKKDLEDIETINIELDHRVSKLIAENEHFKQTYKQIYDSIKPTRIRSKEQCDDLINQVNLNSMEISALNASLQEKVLVITALTDELRKLKGKALADNVHTQEEAVILREIVEQGKSQIPLNESLDSACDKLVDVVPKKKDKRVRFTEPVISSGNTNIKTASSSNLVSNKTMLFRVLDFINDVNARTKSKSVKKNSKRKVWKPTGKVFTNIGYTWRPTGHNC